MIRIEVDGSRLKEGIARLVELGNKDETVHMSLCHIAGIVSINAIIFPCGEKHRSVSVVFAHIDDWGGHTFSGNVYNREMLITAQHVIEHINNLLAEMKEAHPIPTMESIAIQLAIESLLPAVLEKLKEVQA